MICHAKQFLFAPFIHLTFKCVLALALLATGGVVARAQGGGGGGDFTGNGGHHTIRGRIIFPSGRRVDGGLKIKLTSMMSGDMTVLSDSNGTFTFGSLRPGSYEIVIEGGDNFETMTERVVIESDGLNSRSGIAMPTTTRPYTVQIYLQPKRRFTDSSRPGVVNASLVNIPKPALDLYNRAINSAQKGETKKAVEQLKEALALHHDFSLALSELGTQYMKLNEPAKAADALSAALKLSPGDYPTLLTYGIALFEKKEFAAAEENLKEALKKNNASPSAHLYLGITMFKQHNYVEAEKELKVALNFGGDDMAIAHYYLGGLCWGNQNYKEAANELETYLRLVPKAPDAAHVRETIKELRRKS